MSSLGLQAWVQLLNGIRTAFGHSEFMELFEVLHVLCNSYRLASSGVSSSIVYGRFTVDFFKAFVAGIVYAHRQYGVVERQNSRYRGSTCVSRFAETFHLVQEMA
jgi:hypothetical protein